MMNYQHLLFVTYLLLGSSGRQAWALTSYIRHLRQTNASDESGVVVEVDDALKAAIAAAAKKFAVTRRADQAAAAQKLAAAQSLSLSAESDEDAADLRLEALLLRRKSTFQILMSMSESAADKQPATTTTTLDSPKIDGSGVVVEVGDAEKAAIVATAKEFAVTRRADQAAAAQKLAAAHSLSLRAAASDDKDDDDVAADLRLEALLLRRKRTLQILMSAAMADEANTLTNSNHPMATTTSTTG